MNGQRLLLLAIALAGAVGCSSVETDPLPAPGGPPTFVPDSAATSPSIALELNGISDNALMLDVVGRGIGNVYGLAFRLETDGAVLGVETLESSPAWQAPGLIVRAIEPRAGLGVYVVTAQGDQPGIGADGVILGTVHMIRHADADSPVRFVASRNAVVDDTGAPTSGVAFIGGTLVAHP